jgi:beta-glucanase (GH16 family)
MFSLFILAPIVLAQTSVITAGNATGNCVTGRLDFDPLRIYAVSTTTTTIDVSKYDFTIDYGAANFKALSPAGATLSVSKATGSNAGQGARLSTTRYMLYGKFTATMAASPIGGIITTFITMSGRQDEIDWEFIGSQNNQAQSNVFYKGIKEFGIHGGIHKLPNGTIDGLHTYTIDWKSTGLTFSIDGVVVRTYLNNAQATSPLTPAGERWFPTTPSQIQIAVWDGCAGGAGGTCTWAQGPISWGSATSYAATFQSIDVQWYFLLIQLRRG